jgi:hypothetical protein
MLPADGHRTISCIQGIVHFAKSVHRRLKVFQAQIGFYDTIVAAPSRAAALRAWGMHQNLFASGEARVASDEAAMEAATKHPGQPLQRALGSQDAFTLEPTSLPKIPDAPRKRPPPADKPARPKRSVADRTGLNEAEAALEEIETSRRQEEADFQAQMEALDASRRAAQMNYTRTRKQAADRVTVARATYKKAGGTA